MSVDKTDWVNLLVNFRNNKLKRKTLEYDSGHEGIRFDSCIAFVFLSMDQLMKQLFPGSDDPDANSATRFFKETIPRWCESLGFELDDWNLARTRIHQAAHQFSKNCQLPKSLVPAKRNSIPTAISDVAKIAASYHFEITWLVRPEDLKKMAQFSPETMVLSTYVAGQLLTVSKFLELEDKKSEKKENSDETKIVSKEKSKKNEDKPTTKLEQPWNKVVGKKKPKEIRGQNTSVRIGIKPVTVGLHARVLSGGSADKIVQLLKRKSLKASNIKVVNLSNFQKHSTYQIQLDIPVEKQDFWRDYDFWPCGVLVRKWKGSLTRGSHRWFERKLQISGIGMDITKDRIEKHLRSKVYADVEFNELTVSNVSGGKCIVDLKVAFDVRGKIVLKQDLFPANVKLRWLKSENNRANVVWC